MPWGKLYSLKLFLLENTYFDIYGDIQDYTVMYFNMHNAQHAFFFDLFWISLSQFLKVTFTFSLSQFLSCCSKFLTLTLIFLVWAKISKLKFYQELSIIWMSGIKAILWCTKYFEVGRITVWSTSNFRRINQPDINGFYLLSKRVGSHIFSPGSNNICQIRRLFS